MEKKITAYKGFDKTSDAEDFSTRWAKNMKCPKVELNVVKAASMPAQILFDVLDYYKADGKKKTGFAK